jgi:hypothetical protein
MAGCCEHGYEHCGSIQCREFLTLGGSVSSQEGIWSNEIMNQAGRQCMELRDPLIYILSGGVLDIESKVVCSDWQHYVKLHLQGIAEMGGS